VSANDEVALAILAELGDRIPHDVSLVGFDDIEAASLVRQRLDTVSVDKLAMGRLAVSMLVHRMRHPHDPAFVAMQPARLVVRSSSAAPRDRSDTKRCPGSSSSVTVVDESHTTCRRHPWLPRPAEPLTAAVCPFLLDGVVEAQRMGSDTTPKRSW